MAPKPISWAMFFLLMTSGLAWLFTLPVITLIQWLMKCSIDRSLEWRPIELHMVCDGNMSC